MLEQTLIEQFKNDGAVCLRKVFDIQWIELLRAGVECNMARPGINSADNVEGGQPGRFWDDMCNWQIVDEYRDFVLHSPAAALAAELTRSNSMRFFHDHVLVKEPGTSMRTPWHQDAPYYIVDGTQTCSLWIPLDSVSEQVAVQFVAGSHRRGELYRPPSWSEQDADYSSSGFPPLPEISEERDRLLSWAVEPGDAIAFSFRTIHGAPGNRSHTRRRAFSARWIGDDVFYAQRHGPTSPAFPNLRYEPGDVPDDDLFPVIWDAESGYRHGS